MEEAGQRKTVDELIADKDALCLRIAKLKNEIANITEIAGYDHVMREKQWRETLSDLHDEIYRLRFALREIVELKAEVERLQKLDETTAKAYNANLIELSELQHKVAEIAEKCGVPHTNDFDAIETLNRIGGFYLDEIAHQKLIFEVHQKSVSGFLVELYAIMIDPLFDGAMSVGDITTALLHQAKNIRERLAAYYWPCTACGAMNQVEPK